jgi:type II secretory pathway component GspD/PulD (secretin)
MKRLFHRITLGFTAAFLWAVLFAHPAPAQPSDMADATPSTATLLLATLPDEPLSELRFNFRDAPIQMVLEYLSGAAGFVIVKATDVTGRISIESRQPVTPDEAVALLDTVLKEQGYAAIRTGRMLTIVRRDEARTRDIPVRRGNDPDAIERNDQIVTQIIPVRHTTVKELVENLRLFLPSEATLTANEKSNAILLTDTQTNIRRVTEIIRALDQSVSEISTIRVFTLQHADAKVTADMIQNLFKAPTQTSSTENVQRRFIPPFMRGGEGEGGDRSAGAASAAIQASSTVTAIAEERTNSVVVSAPGDFMEAIAGLIAEVDVSTEVLTEVKVFMLKYANATELAEVITNVFGKQSTTTAGQSAVPTRQRFFGPGGMMGMLGAGGTQGGRGGTSAANTLSSRQETASTVLAVADTRTNAVVVSAVSDTMKQIEQVVAELDKDPAKTKRVYTFSLQNANPEEVSTILKEMFGSGTSSSTTTGRAATTTRQGTTGGQTSASGTGTSSRSSSSSGSTRRQ